MGSQEILWATWAVFRFALGTLIVGMTAVITWFLLKSLAPLFKERLAATITICGVVAALVTAALQAIPVPGPQPAPPPTTLALHTSTTTTSTLPRKPAPLPSAEDGTPSPDEGGDTLVSEGFDSLPDGWDLPDDSRLSNGNLVMDVPYEGWTSLPLPGRVPESFDVQAAVGMPEGDFIFTEAGISLGTDRDSRRRFMGDFANYYALIFEGFSGGGGTPQGRNGNTSAVIRLEVRKDHYKFWFNDVLAIETKLPRRGNAVGIDFHRRAGGYPRTTIVSVDKVVVRRID